MDEHTVAAISIAALGNVDAPLPLATKILFMSENG
jgi:hypothetical protein